jgi:perosamine synthetase
MVKSIPVNEPLFEGNEKKYLIECIKSGYISSESPFVEKFEKEFALKIGRRYAIAVTNGTSAIDVAIEALDIKEGDEVIIPSFTIISCALQIVRSGAKPVLIDSDPITWNMDVSQLEKKITKRTKAIMAVHIYGLPVDMKPVLKISKKYNLKLIEDAAELIGQSYNGMPCGSFGDLSTFSFYSNKHITTGEGGMVLTDNFKIAEKCRMLRNLCFNKKKRFVHNRLGWNLRMTGMQAAVGLAQLENLDKVIKKKRWIGSSYNNLLKDVSGLQLPLAETIYAQNIYWVYGLVLDEKLNISANEFLIKLKKKGIGSRPFFYPLHKQPIFKKMNLFTKIKLPVSEKLHKFGFYIPSGLNLNYNDILKVSSVIKKLINY